MASCVFLPRALAILSRYGLAFDTRFHLSLVAQRCAVHLVHRRKRVQAHSCTLVVQHISDWGFEGKARAWSLKGCTLTIVNHNKTEKPKTTRLLLPGHLVPVRLGRACGELKLIEPMTLKMPCRFGAPLVSTPPDHVMFLSLMASGRTG